MTFFTPTQISAYLDEARRLGMRFPKGSESLPLETWVEVANGIGPGAWSRSLRKVSTWLQPFAVIASILHDMGYCCPVKDREHFNRFNDDFYFNICLYVRAHTWRISAIRWLALREASAEYLAVHLGGWDAFLEGRVISELDDTIEGGPETELRSGTGESTFVEGMEDSA